MRRIMMRVINNRLRKSRKIRARKNTKEGHG